MQRIRCPHPFLLTSAGRGRLRVRNPACPCRRLHRAEMHGRSHPPRCTRAERSRHPSDIDPRTDRRSTHRPRDIRCSKRLPQRRGTRPLLRRRTRRPKLPCPHNLLRSPPIPRARPLHRRRVIRTPMPGLPCIRLIRPLSRQLSLQLSRQLSRQLSPPVAPTHLHRSRPRPVIRGRSPWHANPRRRATGTTSR